MESLDALNVEDLSLQGFCSPLRPGYPVSQYGNGGAAFGTLGCFVCDADDSSAIHILSNQHILHYYQDTSFFRPDEKGMNVITCPHVGHITYVAMGRTSAFGEALRIANDRKGGRLQPLVDHHQRNERAYSEGSALQHVEYASVAWYTRGLLANDMDAAIARLYRGAKWANITLSEDHIRPPTGAPAKVGERVWKWGFASGKKKFGRIKKLRAVKPITTTFTIFHDASFPNRLPDRPSITKKDVVFEEVLEIEGENEDEVFQVQGDSGSVLCRESGAALGLMSIRSSEDRIAYAFPIEAVLEALHVRIPAFDSGVAMGPGPAKVTTLPVI